MACYPTFPKKVIAIALLFWLGLVLCAHGQQKQPVTDVKAPPVQSVKSPATVPKAILVPVPNVIGKTQGEADLILKKSGFRVGKVQTTPVGKGAPGKVAKQAPAENTPAAKGVTVDIWIVAKGGLAVKKPPAAAPGQPQPRLYARGKQLFMEFPETVHQVVVFDAQGNVLQQFGNGRRFDMTESLIKTNGGRVYLGIAPSPGSPVPMRWDPRDPDRIPFELARYRNLARARIIPEDDTTMGRSEPANDSIGGAPLLSNGYVEGEVGGDDATDFGQVFLGNVINSSGNPVGFNDYYTLHIDEPKHVRIAVASAGLASGEQVTVSLYDANHTLVASEYYSGNANGCTLTHDLRADWAGVDYPPFPGGDWHILISDSGTNSSGGGSPSAYGLGDPPAAYTRTDGYTISMTLTP